MKLVQRGLPLQLQALQKRFKRHPSIIRLGNKLDTGDGEEGFEPLVVEEPVGIDEENVALASTRTPWGSSQAHTQIGNMGKRGLEDNDDVQL